MTHAPYFWKVEYRKKDFSDWPTVCMADCDTEQVLWKCGIPGDSLDDTAGTSWCGRIAARLDSRPLQGQ